MLREAPAAPLPADAAMAGRYSATRAIFSFPVVLGALLAVLAVLTVRGRFGDPDMWWHLKTGEIIWNTHHIPVTDTFSYTTNNHAYIPHEWLSQLTIYAAYRSGGYAGLMLWMCALSALLVIGSYVLCSLYSGNLKVAFAGALITWLFATIGFSVRPQLLGYVLLECALLVLYLGQARSPRWFWALPPLFAVWVNCHGSFFLGLIVAAATLASAFVELEWGLLVSKRWDAAGRKTLGIALGLSLAALFANPAGLGQVTYPLVTMTKLRLNTTWISEWAPPQFGDSRGVALLAIAGLILLIPLLRRTQVRVQELVLTAVGFGLAIQHSRMLIVFGILAAPIICRLLADCWDRYDARRDHPAANAVMMALSLGAIAVGFPSRPQLIRDVEGAAPVKAVDFINASHLAGNMLNDYVYGGYLIWAAPQHKVFVDGRGDVFELTGVLEDYLQWTSLQADPKALLSKYQISFCLLHADASISRVLALLPGWRQIYSDEMSVIWARDRAASSEAPARTNPPATSVK